MSHLWAISYADPSRANQARDRLFGLEADELLSIKDLVVVARRPDGSFEQETAPGADLAQGAALGFLVGALLAGPAGSAALAAGALLGGSAAGALLGGLVSIFTEVKIDTDFVRQLEQGMKPGSSTLFLLDRVGDLERLLPRLHGLGGDVLRTNVDVERARQIQEALRAETAGPAPGASASGKFEKEPVRSSEGNVGAIQQVEGRP
jgi:uncharacterized membrane protein